MHDDIKTILVNIIGHIKTHTENDLSPTELDKLAGTVEKCLRIKDNIEADILDRTMEIKLIVEHIDVN